MTALEFLARWLGHVPKRYEVRVSYAGAYATRRRRGGPGVTASRVAAWRRV